MGLRILKAVVLPAVIVGAITSFGAPVAVAKDDKKAKAVEKTDADEKASETVTFMGEPITDLSGPYVVAKDVNVRAKPKTKAKKIGSLKRGERVDAQGRAKATASWLAVSQDGEPLGFVYAPMLLPLIDGALDADLRGEVKTAGNGKARATCEYAIRFEGKVPVENDLFDSSDYTVYFRCRGGDKELLFDGPMFLTEAPYKLGMKPEYQITLDLLDISDGYDKVFSTTSLYHSADGAVTYDSATIKALGATPKPKMRVVEDVPGALKAAVDLAVKSWTEKVWKALTEPAGRAGDKEPNEKKAEDAPEKAKKKKTKAK